MFSAGCHFRLQDYKLTLTLLMSRIFANYAHNAFTTNNFAFLTNAFNTGSNFHCITYFFISLATTRRYETFARPDFCPVYDFSYFLTPI